MKFREPTELRRAAGMHRSCGNDAEGERPLLMVEDRADTADSGAHRRHELAASQ